jgi:hypothetical protein
MRSPRSALLALAVIFVVLLIPQFYLAGAGAFFATDYDAHAGLGYALVAVSLAILVLAVVTRSIVVLSAVLFGLMILQMVLAGVGRDSSAWIGALHAVNALVVFGVSGLVAHRAGARPRGIEPGA